jgi:hypothetical protein
MSVKLRYLINIILLSAGIYLVLLDLYCSQLYSQQGQINIIKLMMPIEFNDFGWLDRDILGLSLKYGDILLSFKKDNQVFEINRKAILELTIFYKIKELQYDDHTVHLIFSCNHGDFIQRIELRSNKDQALYRQIGAVREFKKSIQIPDYYPTGEYSMHLQIDSGTKKKIPGIYVLTPTRIIKWDEMAKGKIDVPYKELEFRLGKGKSISELPQWMSGLMLDWSGSECAGHIKLDTPRDLIFNVVARRAGSGRGDPIFAFYINDDLIQNQIVSNKDWISYFIPVHMNKGVYEFMVRFLNGGHYRTLIISKFIIQNNDK